MAQKRSLRSRAEKAFTKKNRQARNDNLDLVYTVSEAERARALNPPVDNDLVEVLHGRRVSDPFRPLEDLKAPATQDWIARQNKKFEDFVAPAQAMRDSTMEFLNKALPAGMAETMPSRYGDIYTCWRRAEGEDRWSLYVKDKPDYDAPARLLLDPNVIDPSGKTNIAGIYFTADGKTLAYTLSKSGSDETTLRFMNVETGAEIGERLEKFRSGVIWDRDGRGFHYRRPKAEGSKSFEVAHHRMGTDPAQDKAIFTPAQEEMAANLFYLPRDMKREVGTYDWIRTSNRERDKNALFVRKHGSGDAFREIFPHQKGTLSPIAEIDGKIYAVTSYDALRQKLVRFDVNDPAPEKWETIIPEDPKDPLISVFAWQGKLFANYTHDTGDLVRIYDPQGKHLGDMPLPPLSTFTPGQIQPDDSTMLLSIDSFQEADAIYRYDATANSLTLVRPSITPIDLKDCIVERLQARSKDGTLVPMTVIRHPDTQLDGTAAVRLYGYGGFNVPLNPAFSKAAAKWVRDGGIFAQANLRGGGEFGQEWYDQGRLHNKQNVFDDFAACAKHLIAQKYTSAKRLAIEGGSNGGLLTLATGIQHPDLFGAIVSEVPVTDMNRFHIGSFYGYSWKSDYGDPDVKEDFNTAAKYSPYHNVREGWKHPPVLIRTDANDDRVLPWHGYKQAALQQAKENKNSLTLLQVEMDGGHGGGGSLKKMYQSVADIYAFLERTLGPIDQKAYKAQLAKKAKGKSRKPGA